VDLLGYVFFNRWFAGMYRGLYKPDKDGRHAMNERELFDRITLKPLDKKDYGTRMTDRILGWVNQADRKLRPVQNLSRSIRFSRKSMTKQFRRPYEPTQHPSQQIPGPPDS
jgi:hypothetical protein